MKLSGIAAGGVSLGAADEDHDNGNNTGENEGKCTKHHIHGSVGSQGGDLTVLTDAGYTGGGN